MSLLNPAGSSGPTFYNVSGCPEDLFKCMIRLGSYAREYELVTTMTCVKFDMEPVAAVELTIRNWVSPVLDDLYGVDLTSHLDNDGYSTELMKIGRAHV